MIAGYHLIWTAYGWWLPNDPRGSSSHEMRVAALQPLGDLHYGRKVLQPSRQELLHFYEAAKKLLQHELLTFTPDDFALIADAFAEVCAERKYTCYACAVMPDHVHMLIRKHRDKAEDMIAQCQVASRKALLDSGRRVADHPVWGGPGWKVFLEAPRDFERIVRYIEQNPLKIGLPAQRWDFVKPYDGWMPFVPPWLRGARNHK